jgi:hypothetical protein
MLMKLTALFPVTGIIGLALFACAPPAPPAPPVQAATASACSDARTALNPVSFLVMGYDPKSNSTPPADPVAIQKDITSDLQNAFSAAPPSFQTQLCGLSGIFIDPTGCMRTNTNSPYDPTTCNASPVAIGSHSWGMRQYDPSNNGVLGKYVALSLGLWNNTGGSLTWSCGTRTYCAPPFQTYQTGVIQGVVSTLSTVSLTNLPTFSAVSPAAANTAAMSVLATLAHDTGHVLWYDTFVPKAGSVAVAVSTRGSCGQFYTASPDWQYALDVPPGRWLNFGQIRNQSATNSTILQLPGLLDSNNSNNLKIAWGDLYHLYAGAHWASALAAFSPDEDFVETFELSVLASANPPLTSMQITIPGFPPYDIFSNLTNGTELARKYMCIGGSLPQFRRQL